jgi:hypothetical protein
MQLMLSIRLSGQGVKPTGTPSQSSRRSLPIERMISPVDTVTPDVLHQGEMIYGQPFALEPGFGLWGITDRLTVLIDLTAWLGGIPDLFLKYSLTDPDGTLFRVTIENMVMYVPQSFGNYNKNAQSGSNDYYMVFERPGWCDVLRIDSSLTVIPGFPRSGWYISKGKATSRSFRMKSLPPGQRARYMAWIEEEPGKASECWRTRWSSA